MRGTGLESTEQVQLQGWTGDEADLQAVSMLRASVSPDIAESLGASLVCPTGKGEQLLSQA